MAKPIESITVDVSMHPNVRQLIEERDALAAQIAATKQALSYVADRMDSHAYDEIASELDDDPLNDDGTVFRVALAKVKADAWDEGIQAGYDHSANQSTPSGIPIDPPANPYREEGTGD